jgi:hypothetical protein
MSKVNSIEPSGLQSVENKRLKITEKREELDALIQKQNKWLIRYKSTQLSSLPIQPRFYDYSLPALLPGSCLEELEEIQKAIQERITLMEIKFGQLEAQQQNFQSAFKSVQKQADDIQAQEYVLKEKNEEQQREIQLEKDSYQKLSQELDELQNQLEQFIEKEKKLKQEENYYSKRFQKLKQTIKQLKQLWAAVFIGSWEIGKEALKNFLEKTAPIYSQVKILLVKVEIVWQRLKQEGIPFIYRETKKVLIKCYHFLSHLELKIIKCAGIALFALILINRAPYTVTFTILLGGYTYYRYQSTICYQLQHLYHLSPAFLNFFNNK